MKIIRNTDILLLVIIFSLQAFAQETPKPAPVFSDLLSGVYLRDSGQFKPRTIYAYFATEAKGYLKVVKGGTEIAKFSYHIEPYSKPKFSFDRFDLVSGKNDTMGLVLKEPGKYELVYFIGDEKIYSFPFDLSVKTVGDVYKPKKLFLLNGAWNDYAYLRKTSEESHGKWEFRIFARNENGKYAQTKGQVLVTRNRDKKLVAVSNGGFRRSGKWERQDFTLAKPGKRNPKTGEYYGNTTLYANKDKLSDGGYTVKFLMDRKLYGTYGFSVKGGKIEFQDRQIREKTDPTLFIEGGGKEFWLRKL